MKIAPKQIESFLRTPAANSVAVLLYGPDQGQAREYMQRIQHVLLGKNASSSQRIEIDDAKLNADITCLHDEAANFDLLGGNKLILLRNAKDKHVQAITQAIPALSAESYLVVWAGELTPRSALRQLFEKEPRLASVPCYLDAGASLQATIRDQLGKSGVQADREVVQYLESQLGNDRAITRQELDKLILYLGEHTLLDMHTAHSVISQNTHDETDDICYAFLPEKITTLDQLLSRYLQSGGTPIMVVRAFIRHIGRLMEVKHRMQEGMSADQAIRQMKPAIFFKKQALFQRQAQYWSVGALTQLLRHAIRLESQLKASYPPHLLLRQHMLVWLAAKNS